MAMYDRSEYLNDDLFEEWLGIEDIEESEELIGTGIIYKTELAVLIMHNDNAAWFPKSVIYTLEEDCMSYNYHFSPIWKPMHKTKMKPIEGDF